ncbi:MAG: fasciclin domain-containing protein [Bacteroidales bacterium]|nr:fasciclin domain-containing protein [Bacteroidales bacterium]
MNRLTKNIMIWISHKAKWLIAAISIFSFSCDTSFEPSFVGEDAFTISQYIETNKEEYSMFWELLNITNLKNTLSMYNPHGNGYTLFMPSNEAFNNYISGNEKYSSFDELLNDLDFANVLIRYHIVNGNIETNDFPFGALPDTTATGDFLTIGFDSSGDTTVYKINNKAPVITSNIELLNGYIHVIGETLEPVAFSGYDWLFENDDFSILSEALTISGLKDTLGIFRNTRTGSLTKNYYTILAESDDVFSMKGINSIDDLIAEYGTPGLELTNLENEFYQFAAYHILEGSYFLDEFDESSNYNTYANFPVKINAGIEIKINPCSDTLDILIEDQDTTFLNYVRLDLIESNILTKNGAIHILLDILNLTNPGRTKRTFEFFEEPVIKELKGTPGEYEFTNPEEMEVLFWMGADRLKYVKSGSSIPTNNNDYIEIEGDFVIEYTIPAILPGLYEVELKTESSNNKNATIQIYVDGKRIGGNFDLKSGGKPFDVFRVGSIEFLKYEEHTITVSSLMPGKLTWDFLRFTPE